MKVVMMIDDDDNDVTRVNIAMIANDSSYSSRDSNEVSLVEMYMTTKQTHIQVM